MASWLLPLLWLAAAMLKSLAAADAGSPAPMVQSGAGERGVVIPALASSGFRSSLPAQCSEDVGDDWAGWTGILGKVMLFVGHCNN